VLDNHSQREYRHPSSWQQLLKYKNMQSLLLSPHQQQQLQQEEEIMNPPSFAHHVIAVVLVKRSATALILARDVFQST